jgi:hypothetical protein
MAVTEPRKVIGRSVVVALGIICILLAAGLLVVFCA